MRETELNLPLLLDNVPAGAYACDRNGLITYFNRHAEALWGRRPRLNHPDDRFCGSFRLFAPDGAQLQPDQSWLALALAENKDFHGYEIIIERPTGERIHVLTHASPIRDESGAVVGGVNILVDVSDRTVAERAQARLAAIVESSDDAIISKTLEGIITTWNTGAEKLFGYEATEAIGQPITLIIPTERYDEEVMILAKLRRGEPVTHYETVRVTKSGRKVAVSLTASPVRDRAGRIIGASKVARDITASKEVEAALHLANRRKDEFLATLAHELRNPLAPVRYGVELLELAGDDKEVSAQARRIIGRQVEQMTRLVDDLLDVSRIGRGKAELRRARASLASVVQSAVETSQPLVDAKQHTLVVTVPPDLMLDIDAVRIAQVVSNLLNNSAKYTKPGGHITLTAGQQGDFAVLTIQDSGIGIPESLLPYVFDVFVQGERSSEDSHGGLGLGLTLAKQLVELHGGTIEARSSGTGQGSSFVVRLPIEAPTPTPISS